MWKLTGANYGKTMVLVSVGQNCVETTIAEATRKLRDMGVSVGQNCVETGRCNGQAGSSVPVSVGQNCVETKKSGVVKGKEWVVSVGQNCVETRPGVPLPRRRVRVSFP